jgi:hypothetical protein
MQNEISVKRCEDASHSHGGSRKTEPRSFCFAKLLECARVLAPLLVLVSSAVCRANDKQLWQIQKMLASKKYVDLTHEFAPGIPRWPGFPDETRKTIYWYEKRPDTMGSGFFSELFTHVGQCGTHVDPPAHFVKGPAHCRPDRPERNGPAAGRYRCA